ncbi:DUF4253 domain-containing protein [Synechocystis sp. LKSZ1]|uniref:DUF4253 domain-containing protein n=1 Tax=Synechocystis sp. LKSZ1 TaxID=3144951 RepID=UPI00336BFAE9
MDDLVPWISQQLSVYPQALTSLRRLSIPASDHVALILEVDPPQALEVWQRLYAGVEQTQYYPVITESWGEEDFFSRFYYQEEKSQGRLADVSPRAIIAQADGQSRESYLRERRQAETEYLETSVADALELTRRRYGQSPDPSEVTALIDQGQIQSRVDLEQWLWQWEQDAFEVSRVMAPDYLDYLDWFSSSSPLTPVLLLPTPNSWDTLAYLHWYGACTCGTSMAIRFLEHWYRQYGAELVCHYGTMLQFRVKRRPQSPTAAFQLAWEQEALAPCTTLLPGVSLRDHARALMTVDHWFLHERP